MKKFIDKYFTFGNILIVLFSWLFVVIYKYRFALFSRYTNCEPDFAFVKLSTQQSNKMKKENIMVRYLAFKDYIIKNPPQMTKETENSLNYETGDFRGSSMEYLLNKYPGVLSVENQNENYYFNLLHSRSNILPNYEVYKYGFDYKERPFLVSSGFPLDKMEEMFPYLFKKDFKELKDIQNGDFFSYKNYTANRIENFSGFVYFCDKYQLILFLHIDTENKKIVVSKFIEYGFRFLYNEAKNFFKGYSPYHTNDVIVDAFSENVVDICDVDLNDGFDTNLKVSILRYDMPVNDDYLLSMKNDNYTSHSRDKINLNQTKRFFVYENFISSFMYKFSNDYQKQLL